MTRISLKPFAVRVLAGFGVFAAAQAVLFMASDGSRLTIDSDGWFLNTGRGVLTLAAAVGLASAGMAALWSARLPQLASPVTLGAVLAMTVALFIIGPGTLFPIVIAVGTAVLGAAAVVGSFVGRSLVVMRHRRGR
jgi:hypothetical protein